MFAGIRRRLHAVRAKPGDKAVDGLEKAEEEAYPHIGKDDQPQEEENPESARSKAPMRMRITVRDLEKYGYTDGCPRCNMHLTGRKSGVNHSEECRARLYKAMRDANDSKLTKAKRLGDEETPASKVQAAEEPSKKLDGDIVISSLNRVWRVWPNLSHRTLRRTLH